MYNLIKNIDKKKNKSTNYKVQSAKYNGYIIREKRRVSN